MAVSKIIKAGLVLLVVKIVVSLMFLSTILEFLSKF